MFLILGGFFITNALLAELVLETSGRPEGEALALVPGGGFMLLDTATTPELEAEGLARDVIRAVQDTRKNAGFDVSDRIRLALRFDDAEDGDAVYAAFDVADVAGETLALEHALLGADDELAESEFTAVIAKGTYANRGDFTVAVSRVGVTA